MCSRELLCLTHLHRQLIPHPHTQTHTPWENRLLFDAGKYSPPFEKRCGREGGEHSVQSAGPSWRRARRGRGGVQARWALFRSQWRPCWEYWTRCSMLLCSVTGPMSRSRSLKNSGETERVVRGIHAQRPVPPRDGSPPAESAPASRESLDWPLLIQTNDTYSARKQGKLTSPGGTVLPAVTPLTLNSA